MQFNITLVIQEGRKVEQRWVQKEEAESVFHLLVKIAQGVIVLNTEGIKLENIIGMEVIES